MSKRREDTDTVDIEEVARRAQVGEDVSEHFTGTFEAKQRVNVDFPLTLLRAIDAECTRVGVTRQAWIKMACDERLRQVRGEAEKRAS
jgi:hypothetical protein